MASLREPALRHDFQVRIDEYMSQINDNAPDVTDVDDVGQSWQTFIDNLYTAVYEVLGSETRRNPDWFDESKGDILPLLKRKNAAHDSYLANPSSAQMKRQWKVACTEAQRELRRIKNEWWTRKAEEIQRLADGNRIYEFYGAVKGIFGPPRRHVTPLKSVDGSTLIKEKSAILRRWSEHFKELLKRRNPVDESFIEELPSLPVIEELDDPPRMDEVSDAIKLLKSGKAAGSDGIPAKCTSTAAQD